MALRALPIVFEKVDACARGDGPGIACDFGDAVWHADSLARHTSPAGVLATGHARLDAELPGGGWPVGALCEILQTHSAQSEWRLLLPALSAAQAQGLRGQSGTGPGQAQSRCTPGQRGAVPPEVASWVVLIGPPQVPFGPALAAQGLAVQQLLWVKAQTPDERLWTAEQALRCTGVVAVLAWLPQVQAAHLRRLQMAALAHAKLLFVMRPAAAQHESSPAVLRLLLLGRARTGLRAVGTGVDSVAEPDALRIQLLKRRGPPLAQTLVLPVTDSGLSGLLRASENLVHGLGPAGDGQTSDKLERQHALDSLAA